LKTKRVLSYLLSFGFLLTFPYLFGQWGLSPLAALLSFSAGSGTMVDFPLGLMIGLQVASFQFGAAAVRFEMTWMRDR